MSKKKDKIPFNKIKVLYSTYDIVPLEERQANLREIFGQFHAKEQVIEYDSTLKNAEKINTIMHEIGHAIFHTMGIKSSNDSDEEVFVNSFTAGLITVFRDNPTLLQWICDNINEEE